MEVINTSLPRLQYHFFGKWFCHVLAGGGESYSLSDYVALEYYYGGCKS